MDDPVHIFKQAETFGWVFSLKKPNQNATLSNNVLFLKSMKLFQQLKKSNMSILEGAKSASDSNNDSSNYNINNYFESIL